MNIFVVMLASITNAGTRVTRVCLWFVSSSLDFFRCILHKTMVLSSSKVASTRKVRTNCNSKSAYSV
jgi:hypothetical protein